MPTRWERHRRAHAALRARSPSSGSTVWRRTRGAAHGVAVRVRRGRRVRRARPPAQRPRHRDHPGRRRLTGRVWCGRRSMGETAAPKPQGAPCDALAAELSGPGRRAGCARGRMEGGRTPRSRGVRGARRYCLEVNRSQQPQVLVARRSPKPLLLRAASARGCTAAHSPSCHRAARRDAELLPPRPGHPLRPHRAVRVRGGQAASTRPCRSGTGEHARAHRGRSRAHGAR